MAGDGNPQSGKLDLVRTVDGDCGHKYTGIFINIFTLKKNSVHMKMQMHAIGGENSARPDVTSQNLQFHCLHNKTATGVFENLYPGRSFQKFLVSVTWSS